MRWPAAIACGAALLAFPVSVLAQGAAPAQAASAVEAAAPVAAAGGSPTLTFMMDWPGQDISHYVVTLHADGTGSFDATGSAAIPQGVMPMSFRVSASAVAQWFDLAKQARYFAGKPDEMKRVAYTGTKTLTWNDGVHPATSAQFSLSNVKPLQELGRQCQALAATLLIGLNLQADERFHPMQSDHDMDALTSSLKDGAASHPEAIEPQLRAIAEDTAVIAKVRRQADAILSKLPQ